MIYKIKNVSIFRSKSIKEGINDMELIQVDQEKCIRCGFCADVCPTNVINMEGDGPRATKQSCIACGHCVAVCPEAALDNVMSLPENMTVTGGLMVGYPKYTYKRLVDRNPLQVTWH